MRPVHPFMRYAPDAVVYNMGPQMVSDFVKQRRRNYAGHPYLQDKYGYKIPSLENVHVLRIALEEVWAAIRLVGILGILATLELYSRALGYWGYRVKKRDHVVWEMAWSTKNPGRAVQQPDGSRGSDSGMVHFSAPRSSELMCGGSGWIPPPIGLW